jgi:hypothetical protein
VEKKQSRKKLLHHRKHQPCHLARVRCPYLPWFKKRRYYAIS